MKPKVVETSVLGSSISVVSPVLSVKSNECEKQEKSGFPWLFQQYVENGQIAAEDDSLGNLNSPASSSVGT